MKSAVFTTLMLLALLIAPAPAADSCCEKHTDATCDMATHQPGQCEHAAGGAVAASNGAVRTVQNKELPEGHPPLKKELPKGHPSVDKPADPALPKGHPSIGGPKMDPNQIVKGNLVIKAEQGTPEGTTIGSNPVTLELYSHAGAPQTINAQLDDHGVLMLEGLTFKGMVQPVVTIKHAGVSYQAIGRPMSANQPEQIVKVKLYDATDEAPDWTVKLRHLYLQAAPTGLHAHEMIVLDNPAERAWVGDPIGDAEQRTTIRLPLAGGPNVQYKVLRAPEKTEIVDDHLVMHGALTPGQTEIRIQYQVPLNGEAALNVTAPVATGDLVVYLPEDGSVLEAAGLETGEPLNSRGTVIRAWRASQIEAGKTFDVKVRTGVTQSAAEAARPLASATGDKVKLIAGAGGLLILITGFSLLMIRTPHAPEIDEA